MVFAVFSFFESKIAINLLHVQCFSGSRNGASLGLFSRNGVASASLLVKNACFNFSTFWHNIVEIGHTSWCPHLNYTHALPSHFLLGTKILCSPNALFSNQSAGRPRCTHCILHKFERTRRSANSTNAARAACCVQGAQDFPCTPRATEIIYYNVMLLLKGIYFNKRLRRKKRLAGISFENVLRTRRRFHRPSEGYVKRQGWHIDKGVGWREL